MCETNFFKLKIMFNQYQNNDLKIRADTFYANHYKKWNPIKNNWDEVGAGGEDHPVELPYYVQASDIDFGSVVINPDGIVLGDNEGNETLTSGNIREDRLTLRAVEETVNQHETLIDDNANNIVTLQDDVNNLQTKTTGLSYNPIGTSTLISNTNKQYFASLDEGLRISKNAAVNNNLPSVTIKNNSIDFWNPTSGNLVFMNYNRVDNLAKLESICSTTFNDKIDFTKNVSMSGIPTSDATNKKMVVLDATTKALTYTDIPSGGSQIPQEALTNILNAEAMYEAAPDEYLAFKRNIYMRAMPERIIINDNHKMIIRDETTGLLSKYTLPVPAYFTIPTLNNTYTNRVVFRNRISTSNDDHVNLGATAVEIANGITLRDDLIRYSRLMNFLTLSHDLIVIDLANDPLTRIGNAASTSTAAVHFIPFEGLTAEHRLVYANYIPSTNDVGSGYNIKSRIGTGLFEDHYSGEGITEYTIPGLYIELTGTQTAMSLKGKYVIRILAPGYFIEKTPVNRDVTA